ncbi:MAG: TonB-dependent receptor [Pseudomonadota bacterium]
MRAAPEQGSNHFNSSEKDIDQIVVTGTNIRGIALDSSPTFVFDDEEIEKSGFLSTEQFMRSIPQVFAGGVSSASARGVPVDLESRSNTTNAGSVNLRGLGAGATLTLLNGRRLAPAGFTGGFTDISAIPLTAIARIEALTDGASSIYGGDAVSGVVNFVMRDDFEGAETRVNYGLVTEGDFDQVRASQTLGTNWGSGNALVSYEFFDQDALLASDKTFAREAFPSETLLPEKQRHSVIGVLSQSLTDKIRLRANGFYADRDSFSANNNDGVLRVRTSNTEQVLVSSSLEYDAFADWRIVLGGDYSEINTSAFNESSFIGSNVVDETRQPETEASQTSVDIMADGSLFELTGGPIKLAVGAAYRDETFERFEAGAPVLDGDRQVWAVFGELFLPVVSTQNSLPGIERLELNVSARHDDYSDFGSSTNPKVGLLWSPFSGLNLRGSYSQSFNPPDLGVAADTQATAIADFADNPANPAVRDIPYLVISRGSVPDLTAENSKAFTAGFDYDFKLKRGQAAISSTYYNIDFEDRIGSVPRPRGLRGDRQLAIFLDAFPTEIVTLDPSLEDVQSVTNTLLSNGGEVLVRSGVDLSNLDFILDRRTRNLSSTKTEGIDMNVSYNIDTGFGAFNASVNANYIIDFTRQAFPTAPVVETFNRPFDPVDLRMRASIGWANNGWRVSSFVNYTDSYNDPDTGPGARIDAWTTMDLNVGYSFRDKGGIPILNNTRFALSILNLFDQDPPAIENDAENGPGFAPASYDSTNAEPLGRFISFSITKRL